MVFFSGWMGYATGYTDGVFVEPTDAAYRRRTIMFSQLSNGWTGSQTGGTVGPAVADWGLLTHAGLFDTESGGVPVICLPLATPVQVAAGSTFSESAGAYMLRLSPTVVDAHASAMWPPGAPIATTQYGAECLAGAVAQLAAGSISRMQFPLDSATKVSALPSAPTGSGTLWSNGGILSVA